MSFWQHGAVLNVAGRSDAGRRRSENQDHFLIADLTPADGGLLVRPGAGAAASDVAARLSVGERGALLLVADGMGGAAAGRLASGLASTFIFADLQEGWQAEPEPVPERFTARLKQAVENANRRIQQHAQRNPECVGMGTTATVAGLLGPRLYLAQVGDSRAYLLRGGRAVQLTRDQSLVQQMVDAGAMTAEEAERSTHGNVILQALGVEAQVAVAMSEQELEPGDVLLLCSDGLYRVVRPEELPDLVGDGIDPARACEQLVALANERGAPDNVTVVVARLESVP
jgi:protein phosphatase